MTYTELVDFVYTHGAEEPNQRTGLKTRRMLAQTVELYSERIFSPRKFSAKIGAAEVAWMLSGDQKITWLQKHTKIWDKFQDEGIPGFISTSYGFRWRYSFQRDQIQEAVELLQRDPSSRQCLVLSWDPRVDGLMNQGKSKNVPCPFAFSLYILKGKGYMVVYQRSADIIVGIPYDLVTYYILAQAIFNTVGAGFAGIQIMIGDAHVYENFYAVTEKMLRAATPMEPHHLRHGWTIPEILRNPDGFVGLFMGRYAGVEWPVPDQLEACK